MVSFDEAIAAGKVTPEQALEIFDSLPAVQPAELIGLWKGASFPTGSPMDHTLEQSGWYGKEFIDENHVHPLVYNTTDGGRFTVDPEKAQATYRSDRAANLSERQSEVQTDETKARIRVVQYRGVPTASMVYNHTPVIDSFRKVDDNTLLGAMESMDLPVPFLFVLRRQ